MSGGQVPCNPQVSRCGCGTPRYEHSECPFCHTENLVCWAATTYACSRCGVRSPT